MSDAPHVSLRKNTGHQIMTHAFVSCRMFIYFIFTETELFELNRLLSQSCAYVLGNKLVKLYYNFILLSATFLNHFLHQSPKPAFS